MTKDEKNKKSEKKVRIKKDLSAKKGKGLKVSFPDDWCLYTKHLANFIDISKQFAWNSIA